MKSIGRREGSVFAFVHVLVPHGPYIFDCDRNCLSTKESIARGARDGYVEQVSYAGKIIRDLVETLLAQDREPSIIIIQSDELGMLCRMPISIRPRGHQGGFGDIMDIKREGGMVNGLERSVLPQEVIHS